jgi:hypothetical protein
MRIILLILIGFLFYQGFAQRKLYEPIKIKDAPKIDGRLEDPVWRNVPEITDFIKSFPDFGKEPTRHTTVKVIYDDIAVYVAAFMFDEPKNIRQQLTQRDVIDFQDADNFTISLDTYQDRQNAFSFTVTAAGVQGDAKISTSDGNGTDRSWDAVWESAVGFTQNGWVAEMKIPFSAIRFAKKDLQNWGLQLSRFIRSKNENITWSPQDPNKDGLINQWGDLNGLKNIIPPLRLSFLPYISGGVRNSPTQNGTKTEKLASGGMDVKYGINESFTLDVTLIPDFAQVQSDNVYLNLSPFQVKFDDFRPFFTEGTELFNKAGLFYSRRIGASPTGVYDVLNFVSNNTQYEIKKNPGITRLYNATKFSGRTKNKLGIGIFNAVTAPMKARLFNKNTKQDSLITTEVLANYNVFVLDQALKNRSSVTFTNTNVVRQGNSRNANVSSLDLSLFDRKNNYKFQATTRYSKIWGSNGNSDGYTGAFGAGKISGIWQYGVNASVESDQYDPNDLGFIFNNNSFEQHGFVSLQYNKPTKKYLSHNYSFNFSNVYLYKPFQWSEMETNLNAFFLFKNFWDVSVNLSAKPIGFNDYFESRTPGINLKRFSYAYSGLNGSTDSRKKLFVNWSFGAAESKDVADDPFFRYDFGTRYRFNAQFQIQANLSSEYDHGGWGFSHRDVVSTRVPGYNDPIIAFRRVKTKNLLLGAQYNFTPRMNWNIRLRHNWTSIVNRSFHKLKIDGSWDDIAFVNGKNRNFNVFNIDMFYTWDFKWGSRLTLSWKNALGSNVSLDPYIYSKYTKNLSAVFDNPHSNELTLKIVYYLDYLNLKKKH